MKRFFIAITAVMLIALSFSACSSSTDGLAEYIASQQKAVSEIAGEVESRINDVSNELNTEEEPTTEEVQVTGLGGSGSFEELEITATRLEGSTVYCNIHNKSKSQTYRLGFANGVIQLKTGDGKVYYIENVNEIIRPEIDEEYYFNFPGYDGGSLPAKLTFMSIRKCNTNGSFQDIEDHELVINVKEKSANAKSTSLSKKSTDKKKKKNKKSEYSNRETTEAPAASNQYTDETTVYVPTSKPCSACGCSGKLGTDQYDPNTGIFIPAPTCWKCNGAGVVYE